MTWSSGSAAPRRGHVALGAALALAMLSLPMGALAEARFDAPAEFTGRFRVGPEMPGKPVHSGDGVRVQGMGLVPGQSVTLQKGLAVLNPGGPATVDDEGNLSLGFTLPEDAETGLHKLVVIAENPSTATVIDVKVSPRIPLSGEDLFSRHGVKGAAGLYQSAYSAASDALFVAASSFRPRGSTLQKLDPETLEVLAEITPPELPEDLRQSPPPGAPQPEGPEPVAVFGIAVDDRQGTVWATNTFHNTVAVYRQGDLSLVRQFPPGEVYHSRDVVVDGERGRAYVSASATNGIHVFDTAALEKRAVIEIDSAQRGGDFSVMSLALDPEGGRLFVVSRTSNELAVIDLDSNEVARVLPVPGAKNASGVAYDAETGRAFVASQDSDNLVILDLDSGEVLHDVAVGAGALNVAFEPVERLAYVSNRGAGTVTVVSPEGEIVANLANGSYPNHVHADGRGNLYAVNKSLAEDDAAGDHVTLIRKAP
ncbi:YncE family protein [Paracoccus siganidrum]|nr:YncE family protein [Paracoccus siganidrum]RMC35226.1 ATP-binding protein [Paracoccus siganidrum]